MRIAPLLLLNACLLPDISDTLDPGPKDGGTTIDTAAGGLLVDATDEYAWVAYDLDTSAFVDEADGTWDLGFKRFEIKSNGGISGDGGVEAVPIPNVDLDEVTEAPVDGWRTDQPDANDDDVPEYALIDWYAYDYDAHLLNPNPFVWVVRSTDDGLFKLAFDSYYDGNGTPARISLRVAPL